MTSMVAPTPMLRHIQPSPPDRSRRAVRPGVTGSTERVAACWAVALSRKHRPERRDYWEASEPGRWAWRQYQYAPVDAGNSTGSRRPRHERQKDARPNAMEAR